MQVVLFGESLCPSCKYFVENVVAPMFDQGLNEHLFRFRYLAYGNARNQSDVRHLSADKPGLLSNTCSSALPDDSASSVAGPRTGPADRRYGGIQHIMQ